MSAVLCADEVPVIGAVSRDEEGEPREEMLFLVPGTDMDTAFQRLLTVLGLGTAQRDFVGTIQQGEVCGAPATEIRVSQLRGCDSRIRWYYALRDRGVIDYNELSAELARITDPRCHVAASLPPQFSSDEEHDAGMRGHGSSRM